MGGIVKFIPKSETPYRWSYSEKAQSTENFFNRVEQRVFNVLTLGSLGVAATSWVGIQSIVDGLTALTFWGISAVEARFMFMGLKWTTRFDDEGKQWVGGNSLMTLGERLHFRPIEYPEEKKK